MTTEVKQTKNNSDPFQTIEILETISRFVTTPKVLLKVNQSFQSAQFALWAEKNAPVLPADYREWIQILTRSDDRLEKVKKKKLLSTQQILIEQIQNLLQIDEPLQMWLLSDENLAVLHFENGVVAFHSFETDKTEILFPITCLPSKMQFYSNSQKFYFQIQNQIVCVDRQAPSKRFFIRTNGSEIQKMQLPSGESPIFTFSIDGIAQTWDSCSGNQLKEINIGSVRLNQIEAFPDRNRFLYINKKHELCESDFQSQKTISDTKKILKVKISANGQYVATISVDRTISIWRGEDMVLTHEVTCPYLPEKLLFSEDGNTLIVSMHSSKEVYYFDVETLILLDTVKNEDSYEFKPALTELTPYESTSNSRSETTHYYRVKKQKGNLLPERIYHQTVDTFTCMDKTAQAFLNESFTTYTIDRLKRLPYETFREVKSLFEKDPENPNLKKVLENTQPKKKTIIEKAKHFSDSKPLEPSK